MSAVDWQPDDTAPHRGSFMLWLDGKVCTAWYSDDLGCWRTNTGEAFGSLPEGSFWAVLPSEPGA